MSSQELEQKIHVLMDAFELLEIGTWEWNFATDLVHWSPSMAKLSGDLAGKRERKSGEALAILFAADLPEIQARIATAVREHRTYGVPGAAR